MQRAGRTWGEKNTCQNTLCLYQCQFGRFVLFRRMCQYRFLARAHMKELKAFTEATVRMRVNIVRLACNYHSKVKSGLIHRGESRADQRDLGEDRTKNVKSRSLWNTEMSICLRTPWCSLRRTWSKPVLQRWSQKMIWPRLHLPAVCLFTFLPVSIYLPELPGTAPFSVFSVFVLLVRLSEYQWSSLTNVLQTQVNSD